MSTQILENRFEIEKKLSHTDFSSVYLACDRHHLHRPHCLVTAINYRDAEMRHRLEREAQVLERLGHHPQIPRVLAYFNRTVTEQTQFSEKQSFYIVHDQITGHSLSTEIAPPKQLSVSYVAKLLQDVLEPLAFAHDQGVIHQNLHPKHLRRQDIDGKIFLTEFGTLAKLARSVLSKNGTLSSSVPVSPHPYIAPEQLQQKPQPASDLYALGLIAIEALTGAHHHHFTYDPNKGLLWRDELKRHPIDLPLPLAEFIDRLIRHSWEDRFTNASEALNTLKAQNAKAQIGSDSRLPTLVVAPGAVTAESSTIAKTYLPPVPGKATHSTKPHSIKPANQYLYKLATGSIAALLAIGIGVKTFQWGEFRLSQLPRTWQDWKQPSATTRYPIAKVDTLIPLMADGSILLQPAAAKAFWDMVAAANADQIKIYPLSGYRAAAPTQAPSDRTPQDYATGYGIDIGGEVEAADKDASFAQTKTFKWLMKNAKAYGFELSLPASRLPGSVSGEPWHWRYVGDTQSQRVFSIKER